MAELKLGKHCGRKGCNQLDFLPFECAYCKGIFCLDHRAEKNHDCSTDISSKNIMPECPICGKKVKVTASQSPDNVVNAHIASGCQADLFDEAEAERREKVKQKKACSLPGCKNPQDYDTVICVRCKMQYCLSHRLPIDHKCDQVIASAPKVNKSASALLQKLRADPDRKKREMEKARAKVKKAAESKKVDVGLLDPIGDGSIKDEDKFWVEAEYPRSYISKKTKIRSVWLNKKWTIGKAIDNICKHLEIENRNNELGAKKLILIGKRNGAEFPSDISLELLNPELVSGDSIQLIYIENVKA